MLRDYLPAHPPTAEALAIEARRAMAARLTGLGQELLAAAKRMTSGEAHGLLSAQKLENEFLNFMRGYPAVPVALIDMLFRAETAIQAYGAAGETYYGGEQAIRAIAPEHVETMRIIVGKYNDAAFAPGDEVAWDDEDGLFFSGHILAIHVNQAVIRDVEMHKQHRPSRVNDLQIVNISRLRQCLDFD